MTAIHTLCSYFITFLVPFIPGVKFGELFLLLILHELIREQRHHLLNTNSFLQKRIERQPKASEGLKILILSVLRWASASFILRFFMSPEIIYIS